jgi:DNA (cytosine-5)-methyltransferase 1
MTKPRIIDLFSGAGLFSEGFRQAGFVPVFAIDLDHDAVKTYNQNIVEVAVVGCVDETIELPKAEVVIAGPPCQGFSTLGRRDPADQRNQLSLALPSLVDKSGASVAVVENVPPFLNSAPWRKMESEFNKLGYAVQTWVLNAAHFGTPQLRERAFTIASRLGHLDEPEGNGDLVQSATIFPRIAKGDPLHVWPVPTDLALTRMNLIPPRGDKRDVLRIAPHLSPPSWARVGAQATDVWGRVDPDKPTNTLRCRFQNPSTGRYIHPTENRVLSLREGARIQGVPDTWRFLGDRTSIARQIGNGVPVALSRAVAQSVFKRLSTSRANHSMENLAFAA